MSCAIALNNELINEVSHKNKDDSWIEKFNS
jgi:hypothetical protein